MKTSFLIHGFDVFSKTLLNISDNYEEIFSLIISSANNISYHISNDKLYDIHINYFIVILCSVGIILLLIGLISLLCKLDIIFLYLRFELLFISLTMFIYICIYIYINNDIIMLSTNINSEAGNDIIMLSTNTNSEAGNLQIDPVTTNTSQQGKTFPSNEIYLKVTSQHSDSVIFEGKVELLNITNIPTTADFLYNDEELSLKGGKIMAINKEAVIEATNGGVKITDNNSTLYENKTSPVCVEIKPGIFKVYTVDTAKEIKKLAVGINPK